MILTDKTTAVFDYQQFYNEAPVGYFTSNARGIIVNANQFFLALVDQTAEEVFGKMGLQDFLTIGGKIYFQTHYFPLLQVDGGVKEIHLDILRKDKSKVPILINTSRSNQYGEDAPVFHSVIFHIPQRSLFEKELITEKKKAEELNLQLQQTNENILTQAEIIRKQNKSLDRLNAIKDKFFGIVAHDIKGPLNNLFSFVALVKSHYDILKKEDLKMMSFQIAESMTNTMVLVDNLLEWAQSQMQEYKVITSVFFLGEAVEEVINSTIPIAEKKEIQVTFEVDGNPKVRADKNQLHFIIRNLLTNAIKFTSEGGFIKMHCYEVGENKVKISVTDNGVGMSKAYTQTIFLEGKRTTKQGTAGEMGNGIGLLLVKEFVEMNNGTIEVFSEEGKGSTFLVTLNSGD